MENINPEYIKKISEISLKYSNIHSQLDRLIFEINSLSETKDGLLEELKSLRDSEEILINKIESEHGIKFNMAQFLETLNTNDQL